LYGASGDSDWEIVRNVGIGFLSSREFSIGSIEKNANWAETKEDIGEEVHWALGSE
jgi:hypothetical protein